MSIVIPGTSRPSNLHLSYEGNTTLVESDLYNICERIKEISPRLYIVQSERPDGVAFVIMEQCVDGVDRIALRATELDERVLRKLRYIIGVPLETRLAYAEKIESEWERQSKEEQLDDLWERLGAPMLHQLHKDGFTDHNPVSYGKPKGRRRG